jgi:hypothetical protein
MTLTDQLEQQGTLERTGLDPAKIDDICVGMFVLLSTYRSLSSYHEFVD